ncbi:GH36-type glycosyl hydrolase domain-containing protein, partial [Hungatella effluvii]|uniref:GH36-type glycosyl hydrolase domain-containing protein n=1 Tax=Hungatella effluvii TaxID=1096246 RepID=UPI002A83FDFA
MSDHEVWKKPGYSTEGYECAGVIRFEEMTLKPGASCSFYLVLSYMEEGKEYLEKEKAEAAFESMKRYWKKQKIAGCSTGNQTFDRWMQWVSLQPELRRIYGCSFLPHHDYGRGGRGWRDLWQDCLALILKNPAAVREDMVAFFAGIRPDGSNATIIGSGRGTFKADRNAIVRMWMDHGYWPYRTVRLYLDATGDVEFLFEKNTYFVDGVRTRAGGREKGSAGEEGREAYRGTLLEHLLVQHLTQFYDVGLHGHMRLRGADWNDALDMAGENGESVAFTAAYSGNLRELAELITWLREEKGVAAVEVAEELGTLLCADRELYDRPHGKQELLGAYCERCLHGFCGRTVTVDTGRLSGILDAMGAWIQQHIRLTETIKDGEDNLWFNGYYDNHGMQAEGVFQENVRMMLTSQVFSILSGTATDEQVERIVGAADRYLYEKSAGGYRLNTDFKEVKLDLGRMFGFAYGHKENGAVFCHMAVMYAYALYRRRFAREGYRVIESLYGQCMDFETSRLYPGIPEYFNERGRGMYPWLTGAGSWLILTLLTQIFGAEGEYGSLTLHPQLLAEQFDREGNARIAFSFAGRKMNLIYQNPKHLEVGDYEVVEICLDSRPLPFDKKNPV